MRRIHRLRRALIGFKLVFGTVEVAAGGVWLAVPGAVAGAAAGILPIPLAAHHPRIVGAALVVLGLVKVAGAVGLIAGTVWGWRVMFASVALLLPYDAYAAALFAPVDLAILALLWRYRVPLGGGGAVITMRPDAGARQEARPARLVAGGRGRARAGDQ